MYPSASSGTRMEEEKPRNKHGISVLDDWKKSYSNNRVSRFSDQEKDEQKHSQGGHQSHATPTHKISQFAYSSPMKGSSLKLNKTQSYRDPRSFHRQKEYSSRNTGYFDKQDKYSKQNKYLKYNEKFKKNDKKDFGYKMKNKKSRFSCNPPKDDHYKDYKEKGLRKYKQEHDHHQHHEHHDHHDHHKFQKKVHIYDRKTKHSKYHKKYDNYDNYEKSNKRFGHNPSKSSFHNQGSGYHKKTSKYHSNHNSSSLSNEKLKFKRKISSKHDKYDFHQKKPSFNYQFPLKKHKSMYEFVNFEDKYHTKKKTRFSQLQSSIIYEEEEQKNKKEFKIKTEIQKLIENIEARKSGKNLQGKMNIEELVYKLKHNITQLLQINFLQNFFFVKAYKKYQLYSIQDEKEFIELERETDQRDILLKNCKNPFDKNEESNQVSCIFVNKHEIDHQDYEARLRQLGKRINDQKRELEEQDQKIFQKQEQLQFAQDQKEITEKRIKRIDELSNNLKKIQKNTQMDFE